MATALMERPLRDYARALEVPSGGRRLTLEQRLQGAWEGLRADGATECPLCHARMVARERSGACTSCGTQLA
jgi:ribosomal protein L37AE/L43A